MVFILQRASHYYTGISKNLKIIVISVDDKMCGGKLEVMC